MDLKSLKNKALEIARKSPHRIKMGAVIFKKNRIISTGFNHPMRSAKHLHPIYQQWRGSIHAEVSAILSARTDLKGCNIIVVRVNRFGEIRNSEPCSHCYAYLWDVGIRRVFFNQDGFDRFLDIKQVSM